MCVQGKQVQSISLLICHFSVGVCMQRSTRMAGMAAPVPAACSSTLLYAELHMQPHCPTAVFSSHHRPGNSLGKPRTTSCPSHPMSFAPAHVLQEEGCSDTGYHPQPQKLSTLWQGLRLCSFGIWGEHSSLALCSRQPLPALLLSVMDQGHLSCLFWVLCTRAFHHLALSITYQTLQQCKDPFSTTTAQW